MAVVPNCSGSPDFPSGSPAILGRHQENQPVQLNAEWVEYGSALGPTDADLVRLVPVAASAPGVVVVQEMWRVDAHIRDVALAVHAFVPVPA